MRRKLALVVAAACLLLAVAGCSAGDPKRAAQPTTFASPTGRPTSLPVVQLNQAPTQPARPSPTFTLESAAATHVQSAVAFTLTILHTGQVYGEILPCG